MAETIKTQQAIQQWEYKIFDIHKYGYDEQKIEQKLHELNLLGKQGWEVIAPFNLNGYTNKVILKRPIVQ
jgi:hypothetical protein